MPLKDNFIFKEVQEEYMLIPVANGNMNMSRVFNLNETGAFIIKKLQEEDSVSYVVSEMVKEYDADKKLIEADVKEFIKELKKRGFYE